MSKGKVKPKKKEPSKRAKIRMAIALGRMR